MKKGKQLLKEYRKKVEDYVLSQSKKGTKVLNVFYEESISFLGTEYPIFLVATNEPPPHNEWHVVEGPIVNLYSKAVFKSADEAFSMNLGLSMRMNEDKMIEEMREEMEEENFHEGGGVVN